MPIKRRELGSWAALRSLARAKCPVATPQSPPPTTSNEWHRHRGGPGAQRLRGKSGPNNGEDYVDTLTGSAAGEVCGHQTEEKGHGRRHRRGGSGRRPERERERVMRTFSTITRWQRRNMGRGPVVVGRRPCEPHYPTLLSLGGGSHLKKGEPPFPYKTSLLG
jgi:hypothetical protein